MISQSIKIISGTTLCSQRLMAKGIWIWMSAALRQWITENGTRLHALFKKSNTTGFPMLSYSQQSRPSIFPVKLTKRIKMLQVTFTKYADRWEKYILVCLWQQKPPPKSAAILLNWRSTQVLQKGLWLLESGRKRNICCLHHTSDSSLAQSKYSPSKVPTLATRG